MVAAIVTQAKWQQIESKQEQKQNKGYKRNKSSKESKNDRETKCRTIVVVKYQNYEFCASKLESTTGTLFYTHLDMIIFISIQTNVAQIYVPYLEWRFAQEVVWKEGADKVKDKDSVQVKFRNKSAEKCWRQIGET